MIKADAMRVLDEFKAAIRCPAGYDRADKYRFGFLLNYLEWHFSAASPRTFDLEKLTAVREIRDEWQKQRLDETGGSAGISGIIARVEQLIPALPENTPPGQPNVVDLSHLAVYAEPVIRAHASRILV